MTFPRSITILLALLAILTGYQLAPSTDRAVSLIHDRCVTKCGSVVRNTRAHPDRIAACVNACDQAAGVSTCN